MRSGLPTAWGLLSMLEGENPGAAVSLVLCQPTDLGSELGGWEVRATVSSVPLAGDLSIVSSTLGWLL